MERITMRVKIFFRRLKNRIKYVLEFKDIWQWEYESCELCGSCFRIAYTLKNEIWNKIYGSDNGCLCLNCLIKKAAKKNMFLDYKDFKWLCIFTPDKGPTKTIIKSKSFQRMHKR
jgi:hypothetical protein